MTITATAPDWGLTGFIDVGLHVITGTTKSGKSRLAKGIAATSAYTHGLRHHAPVYYLTTGRNARTVAEYLRRLGGHDAWDLTFRLFDPQGPAEAVRIDAISHLAKQQHPTMLIIDDLRLTIEDAHRLHHAAHRFGAAIIFTHCLRKLWQLDPSGTPGIVGTADTWMHITGSPLRGARLTVTGRDIDTRTHELINLPNVNGWQIGDQA